MFLSITSLARFSGTNHSLDKNSLETPLDLEAWADEILVSTYSSSSGFRTDLSVDSTSSHLENEGLSMSNTEQGSEETLQLPIDALSLEISPLKLIALQKVTLELGFEYYSTDGDTENAVDTLASMLASQSLADTEAIVEAQS